MKLHLSLLEAVARTVHIIFTENKMADKAIQAALKSNKKWGARDRAFVAKYSYEIVRWWRLLHYINESNVDNLRPATIWRIVGIALRLTDIELPEIPEFKGLSRNKIRERFDEAQRTRRLRESMPDWLDDMMSAELGSSNWDKMSAALNHSAPLAIRVNTEKVNFEALKSSLAKSNVEILPVPNVANAAYIKERMNLFGLVEFKNGFFEVQDAGSQLISQFLGVAPGMRVVDACAGAGGKSLHLSNLMGNKGTIIAMDTEEWKLEELKKRAKRNGAHNIDAKVVTGKIVKRMRETADALLLDVPCSGLGVLRRNPDAKWKLQPSFIEELKAKQAFIIDSYSSIVKPGGKMVYATCSILPSENEKQVELFLSNHPEFSLVKQHRTTTYEDGFDGFYMALLEKSKTIMAKPEVE
jgi:16S rRNA (cytosine967-C5)-methyltransferase